MVWIERSHARGNPACAWAEVPFVNVAVIVDDEGHDAGVAVLRRVSDKADPADHVAAHDVVDGAARSVRALAGQDLVVVAVIGLSGADAIAFLGRARHRLTKRTVGLASRRRPI